MEYKLQMKFYYVDGSEQYINVKTDSIELAILDYKNRIKIEKWLEVKDDIGDLAMINTSNIINVTFEEVK